MDIDPRAFGAQAGVSAAFDELWGRHHLGDDEAGAQARHKPPERRIRDARHWGEHNAVRQIRSGRWPGRLICQDRQSRRVAHQLIIACGLHRV